MNIRILKNEEIKEIAPLMFSLYKKWDKVDKIDKIDNNWFLSNKQYNYLKKTQVDNNKLFLVAEENNKIIGYLLAEIEERKPFLQKTGYIAETYIKPQYRTKGAGSELFKNAMNWFKRKKIKWIIVGTHSLDNEAISFWQGRGFREFNKFFKMEYQAFTKSKAFNRI